MPRFKLFSLVLWLIITFVAGSVQAQTVANDVSSVEDRIASCHLSTDTSEENPCLRLALHFGYSKNPNRSPAKALEFYILSCEKGVHTGCDGAGRMLFDKDKSFRNIPKGVLYLNRACSGRYNQSCQRLADYYYDLKDFSRAIKYYYSACNENNPMERTLWACFNAGYMHDAGIGTIKNFSKALMYYGFSCQDNKSNDYIMGVACYNIALLYHRGGVVAQNRTAAVKYFELSCRDGYLDGCNEAGIAHFEGVSVVQNYERAAYYYQQGCSTDSVNSAKNFWSCGNLGHLYGQGLGVEMDKVKALQLYEMACRNGAVIKCADAGSAYDLGVGTAENDRRAVEYYNLVCRGNTAVDFISDADWACYNLTIILQDGRGDLGNKVRAFEILKFLCAKSYASGCLNLGWTYDSGLGVAKNEKSALMYYKKALSLFLAEDDSMNADDIILTRNNIDLILNPRRNEGASSNISRDEYIPRVKTCRQVMDANGISGGGFWVTVCDRN